MPAQISVSQLSELVASGQRVYLVDVRQPWEHDMAALPRTDVLVPLDQLPDRTDEITPPEGALVVTYCHHGIRSLNAAAMLEQAGHTRVASLAGGIDRWSIEIDPTLPRY
jgi:adenylyltransferase/sulfurtransferase